MSQSRMAVITFLEGAPVDPGFGQPAPPVYPSQGLPGLPPFAVQLPVFPFDPTDPGYGVGRPDRPDQGLPGRPARPDQGLPGSGARPDQGLPSHGHVDNGLPVPGKRYVVKWLACVGLILVPDNSLPSTGTTPDNTLPPTAEPKQ